MRCVAITVCYSDPDDEQHDVQFREQWEAWHPDVPLITLHTRHRSLGPPVVEYLRAREQEDPHRRVVVLIPEVQPEHWWRWFLHNQRGYVLNRAVANGTENVVHLPRSGSGWPTWPRTRSRAACRRIATAAPGRAPHLPAHPAVAGVGGSCH